MKHLEIKSIEHKGVNVLVKIDYVSQTISLVEMQENTTPALFKPKDWRFHNREIGYMDGWVNICEAIIFAVKAAKKDLAEYIEERSKVAEKRMMDLAKEEGLRDRRSK